MKMSERVRDLRHRVADIMGGVTGPQDYELDGAILAAFEEVAQKERDRLLDLFSKRMGLSVTSLLEYLPELDLPPRTPDSGKG